MSGLTHLLRSLLAAAMAFVAFAAGATLGAATVAAGTPWGDSPVVIAYGFGLAIVGSAGGTMLARRLSPAALRVAVSAASLAAVLAALWISGRSEG